MELEGDGDTNCNWYSQQRISKETGRLRNKRTSRDYPDYCIVKFIQNTEKSPGDLRRLVLIQTPAESNQLTLVRKTFKGIIIIIITQRLATGGYVVTGRK